jgi:hypothetical protein
LKFLQMEPYAHRHQHNQQTGAVQLPFDLQRDALCNATCADGSDRISLLAPVRAGHRSNQ